MAVALANRFRLPNVYREMATFLVVGGISALLYAVIGAGLTVAGLRPSLAMLMSLMVLIPPTYLAQRRFAFRSDRQHRAAFPRYILTQMLGNGVGLIGAEWFPSQFHNEPLLAFVIAAIVIAATNYVCLKFWTFGTAR